MRIVLVGADFEENLALGILAAAVEAAGHEPQVVPLNRPEEGSARISDIVAAAPDVVGLSIQFQHRADEFLAFARGLRAEGYRGHITAGGHFPTMAYAESLEGGHGLDSVVLHDGEEALVALLTAVERGTPLADVSGLALLGDDGTATRTAGRRLIDDLDGLPLTKRYRPHTLHLGIPFIPISGGRGCWGECTFCSIQTVYHDARCHGGGRLLRQRSVDEIAAEMALLWHEAGGPSIFCFHDDNFLLPRPEDTLARLRSLRQRLSDYGVGEIGIVGKCRPDALTRKLARQLASLGVIRLYVGVENASEAGAAHLGRAAQQPAIREALEACRAAGIMACYNLLIFEPDATLSDVRDNLRFMQAHADRPVNFCRAEPYVGTPLQRTIRARQAHSGDDLGWNYRIEDDRTELLYRVCATVFDERNFATDGVANRYMGLSYAAKLLEHFHADSGEADGFVRRARQLTRDITLDTADYLSRAIELTESVSLDDWDLIERRTATLGLEIAAADRIWHREIDELLAEMDDFAASPPAVKPPLEPTERFLNLKRSVALGLSLAVVWTGCDSESTAVDPAPGGFGGTTGTGSTGDPAPGGFGGTAVDPAPGGMGGVGGTGGGGYGGTVVDPAPGGFGGAAGGNGGSAKLDDATVPTPIHDAGDVQPPRHALIDQWRNSGAQRAARTADLPLFDPPRPELHGVRRGDTIEVALRGAPATISTRWQADGAVVCHERSCQWRPASPTERLRVAVRAHGGIAVLTLRADETPRAS